MDHERLAQFKDNLKMEAEELLLRGFPATILRLNEVIETPKFKKRQFHDIHLSPVNVTAESGDECEPIPAKRPCLSSRIPVVPINEHVVDLVETVKPWMTKLLEDAKLIKMWISVMIPKIEDGNNFGVEIQEEAFMHVHAAERVAASFFDSITNYFTMRGKAVKNSTMDPHIEDYRRAVIELDEREYLGFCMVLSEIRNMYCCMHDAVIKNLDKIKTPRSLPHVEALYGMV